MSETTLPKFAELPGASLPVQPPFPFEGMSARVFPLRASLDTLQRFVDAYLNGVPPEVGRFRVAVPYVYLCLLDYGKMAIEVNNYGWLAQREILFNVAVEWYRVVNGRWQFHDWASVAPFIYVDDDMSMTVGRSVYGWPKTIAAVTPVASGWLKDTKSPVNVATIKTMVFEDLYAGEKMEQQPLLEVDREAPMSALRVPFDALSRLTPWSIASNMAYSASVLTRDALKLLPGLGFLPTNEASRPENYVAMMAKLSTMAFPLRPNVSANTLNLKQFRMSEAPNRYCYQALTNGPMRFTALSGAGVLGEQSLLLGDLSGGHTIRLHQWPTLPIAQTLGLEVQRTVRGPGCDVALLKPVAPFWYKANVVYEPGTTLAWRTRDGVWHDTEGKQVATSGGVAESEKSFNTTLGASNRTIAGPFRFSDTTVRVLPLLAWRTELEKFVDGFLNDALGGGPEKDGERLRLWAAGDDDTHGAPEGEEADGELRVAPGVAYVYLVVTSIGEVTSHTDNIGDWADYELSFCVPVLREYWEGGKCELRGAGLVQAFTFADNPTAAAASSEVLGIPTSNARFILPQEQWMSYEGPSTTVDKRLLQVDAEVLPVVGGGEKAERRTILNIYDGEPPEVDDAAWRAVADLWGTALKGELERKKAARAPGSESKKRIDKARSMALDLLTARVPFSIYTIKQFRDVAEPDRACYQSFVRVHRKASEIMDLREIERPIHIRINEYPTQPLVDMLGLVAQPVDSHSGGVVYALQPIRPFWLSGTIEEELGKPVAIRTADGAWTRSEGETYLQSLPGANRKDSHRVGARVGLSLDLGDPRRMTKAVLDWPIRAARRQGEQPEVELYSELDAEAVEAALRTVDPQTVIESILSREWGSWDADARWVGGHRELRAKVLKILAGEALDEIGAEGVKVFEELVEDKGRFHPWLKKKKVEDLIDLLKDFTHLHAQLDRAWNDLADSLRTGDGAPPHDELEAFLGIADKIARRNMDLPGMEDAQAVDHGPALARLIEGAQTTRDEEASAQRQRLTRIVSLARERCRLPADGVFNCVSKAWQKPDYVVPRSAVGEADRERIFPEIHSWDDKWYVGPPAGDDAGREGATGEEPMPTEQLPPPPDDELPEGPTWSGERI